MLKKWSILFISAMLALTACHSPVYNQTEANVADVKLKAESARKKSDNLAKASPALLVKQGDYVDTTPISLYRKPSWLKNHIEIRGDSLPFSYYSRTIAKGAGSKILTKYQGGLDSSTRVSLNYSGTVEGALDMLATKAGYVYSISKNKIFWKAFVTRTYDVAFMPGGTDYLMGKAKGSTGSSGTSGSGSGSGETTSFGNDAADAEYSSLSGTLSVWQDLKSTVEQLLSKDGRVTVSESTTTVTVRDHPTNVNLIGQYIKNLNTNLSKQVLVKIQILEVTLANDFSFGINWDAITRAFHNSPFQLNANYGTPITISSGTTAIFGTNPSLIERSGSVPSYQVLFNALNQQGKTSVVSEPRVVCLNNQVSVVRVTESEGYVASIENTSTGGAGTTTAAQNTVTSQITPGTLITGLTLYVLPKILGEKVYMQVNADLSTKIDLKTFPTGATATDAQVQLPEVRAKHFNQRGVLKSGDTLILAGFRQLSNQSKAEQLLKSQSLGGKASTQENTETIVLITPIILHGSA